MKVSLVFFGSTYVGSTEYGYDLRNNLTSITNDIGGAAFTQLYGYGATSVAGSAENAKDNLPTIYTVLDVPTNYYYNSLNQLTKREVGISGNPITNTYTYKMNGTLYTNQLATENIEGTAYGYEYDDVGNITNITKAGSPFRSYTYDGLNRLKTETLNGSTVNSWEYDDLGNIISKTTTAGSTKTGIDYVYGTSSNCGWENLLTSVKFVVYNGDGSKTVTKQENVYYDAIGNPYSYRGAIMGWYGRQMTTYSKNGVSASFTYDADGLRTTKTVNDSKTEYQYVGDKLFYEKRGDGNSFYYFYDSYGKLSAIYHYVNGTRVPYHVVTNAQGDVMALYNWSGTKVAEYSYDAWGNCSILSDSTSTGIATLNPFRYRSYYYDNDLGLYYLQSRYYDSEIGRFINADSFVTTGQGVMSYNMFAYCGNNPVCRFDNTGYDWDSFKKSFLRKWDNFTTWLSNKVSPNHNVPIYEQGDTNLCWAYSQVMVEDSIAGVTHTQEEADIRARELGEALNGEENWAAPGWPSNAGERIVVDNFYDVAMAVTDNPVYATYNNGTEIGHMVVVTGVDLKNKTIFINNPWGHSGGLTYDEFLQGFPGEDETVDDYSF